MHYTAQTRFHKVRKEFSLECLSDWRLNIQKLSKFIPMNRLSWIEEEKDSVKNDQTREVVPDRKKIARMKERRACIILGESLNILRPNGRTDFIIFR